MSGTAGTIDADMKGNIWVTSPDGALRFNIAEERFTEFKSETYKNERGTATVYGLAADAAGNGWWLLMTQDLVNYSDITTGKSHEFKLPPEQAVMENLHARAAQVLRDLRAAGLQHAVRLGAGAAADGRRQERRATSGSAIPSAATSREINIHTKEVTLVPLPNPEAHQPYQVAVDKNHNVWTNLWSTDKVAKYNPATQQWTLFDLPNRGTESRYISLLERDGPADAGDRALLRAPARSACSRRAARQEIAALRDAGQALKCRGVRDDG